MRIIVAHGADESIDGPKGRRKTDVQEVSPASCARPGTRS